MWYGGFLDLSIMSDYQIAHCIDDLGDQIELLRDIETVYNNECIEELNDLLSFKYSLVITRKISERQSTFIIMACKQTRNIPVNIQANIPVNTQQKNVNTKINDNHPADLH